MSYSSPSIKTGAMVGLARSIRSLLVQIASLGLILVASGCAGYRFQGLQKGVPANLAHRQIFAEGGLVRDSYVLQPADTLVFQIRGEQGQLLSISSVQDENGDTWMCCHSPRFRVPVRRADDRLIRFSSPGPAGGSWTFRTPLAGRTWAEIKLAAAAAATIPGTASTLEVALEPSGIPDLLSANDIVEMSRQYRVSFAQMGDGAPADPFSVTQSDQYRLVVDHRGQVRFPALSLFSRLVDADTDAEARALQGELASADATLLLADPALRRDQQLSLQELAACLSEGELFRYAQQGNTLVPTANERCWRAGVRPRLLPAADGSATISNLVYSLRPGARTWWLVDELGNRTELPFRVGDTVPATALQQRARLTGRRLFGTFQRAAFVIVVPRQTLAADLDPPFYLEIREGQTETQNFLIWPGDTVFISQSRPRPLN